MACSRCKRFQGAAFQFVADDLLVFEVPKMVKIPDRKLGCLQLLCFLTVACYTIGYQVLLSNQYMAFYPAQSVFKMEIQQIRRKDGVDPWYPSMGCEPGDDDCATVGPSLDSLPYCCNSSCSFKYANPDQCDCPWPLPAGLNKSLTCVFDDFMANGNRNLPNRLFLMTHKLQFNQIYNDSCLTAKTCRKEWVTFATQEHYLAGAEDFILRLDHSVTQTNLGIEHSANDMNGALWVEGFNDVEKELCANPPNDAKVAYKYHPDISKETTKQPPCFIPPDFVYTGLEGNEPAGNNTDAFHLKTIIRAFGGDLDSTNARLNGVGIQVTVVYLNVYGKIEGTGPARFGEQHPYYFYRVTGSFDAGFRDLGILWVNETNRLYEESAGVSLTFVADGTLGRFDFLSLTQVLVTSATLTGVATILGTYVASKLLRRSRYYRYLMKEPIQDLEGCEELQKLSVDELDNELKMRGLPTIGSRTAKEVRLIEAKQHENEMEMEMETSRQQSDLSTQAALSQAQPLQDVDLVDEEQPPDEVDALAPAVITRHRSLVHLEVQGGRTAAPH